MAYTPTLADIKSFESGASEEKKNSSPPTPVNMSNNSGYMPSLSDAEMLDNQAANQDMPAPASNPSKGNDRLGLMQPGIMQNLTAGILSSLQALGQGMPDMANMVPDAAQKALPYKSGERPVDNFDPYGTVGTADQPIDTAAGLEQVLGQLFTPGKALKDSGALTKAKSLANNIADHFSSEKAANSLMKELGAGAENTQQSGKSIAKDIKTKYSSNYAQPEINYKFLDSQVGKGKLYEKVDPLISTSMNKEKALFNKADDLNIGDLYDKFKANPTYSNAHNLQSEIGHLSNQLSTGLDKSASTRNEISRLNKIRSSLKDDISSYLQRVGDQDGFDYKKMYDTATSLYEKNVAPYLSTKKLRELVRGGKTNVKNIHNIFESPHDIENPLTGDFKQGPINKILEDLPESTKGQILFNKVGGYKNIKDPNALAKSLQKELQGEYAHLSSPNLQDNLVNILNKQRNKDILVKGATYGIPGGLIGAGTEELIRRNI